MVRVCVCVFFYFESLLNWFACKNELNQSVMQANGQLFEMKVSYFCPIGWTKILNFWPCLSGAQIFYGFLQAVHEYYNLHEISINFPAEIASPSSHHGKTVERTYYRSVLFIFGTFVEIRLFRKIGHICWDCVSVPAAIEIQISQIYLDYICAHLFSFRWMPGTRFTERSNSIRTICTQSKRIK